jgi:hypothetical protein
MTEIEMTEFFESYGRMPAFSRIKKIYDITNNLDLFLLKILRSDFRRYSLKKYFQLVKDFHSGEISDVGYEYDATMSFKSFNLKIMINNRIKMKHLMKLFGLYLKGIVKTQKLSLRECLNFYMKLMN